MTSDDLDIHTTLTIDAPPATVWDYLTSDEHVPNWLGCMRYTKGIDNLFYMQQDSSKRAADDIEGATHCRIVKLDEPREFSFSWFLPGTPETIVSIRLQAIDTGTEVTLSHTGWDQFDAEAIRQIRDALAGGWTSYVLPGLKRIVEA